MLVKSELIKGRIKNSVWVVERELINDNNIKNKVHNFYKTVSRNIEGINVIEADNYVYLISVTSEAEFKLNKLSDELEFLEEIIDSSIEIASTYSKKLAQKYLFEIERESNGMYVGSVGLEDIVTIYETNDFWSNKSGDKNGGNMSINIVGSNNIMQVGDGNNGSITKTSQIEFKQIIENIIEINDLLLESGIAKNEIDNVSKYPSRENIFKFGKLLVPLLTVTPKIIDLYQKIQSLS